MADEVLPQPEIKPVAKEFADPLNPTAAELRATRQTDYDIGSARGKELFKPGALGRLSTNEDMAAILQRRREQQAGLSPQQMDMMRAQQLQGINSSVQGNLRQLKGVQGASGVQGGLANSQLANALGQGAALRNNAEAQLQMANLNQQQQGLDSYQTLARDVAAYDIAQANKERLGEYSTGITEQALGSADRGAILARSVAKDNAGQQVAVQQSGGKK